MAEKLTDFIDEKPEVRKTTVDCDAKLLEKAHKVMEKKGHTTRQVFEAALKKYIEENK